MREEAIFVRRVAVATVTAAVLSLSLMPAARAQQRPNAQPAHWSTYPASQCRIVGAISHRCYAFHSDAAWREGLTDYHGSNGG